MPHRALRVALLATPLLVPLVAGPAAQAATVHCRPSHATTLRSTGAVRVYARGTHAYACLRSTGRTIGLAGADPASDRFAIGGGYVGWTRGATHSIVTVEHIADAAISRDYPFDTNDTVGKVVVKPSGAAAWAARSSDGTSYVQGFDRKNHSADTFSDDTRSVILSSLASKRGHLITWSYRTGPAGRANLY